MHRYPSLFEDYNQYSTGVWNSQVRWSTLSPDASTGSKPLTEDAMDFNHRSLSLKAIMLEMNFTMQWDMSGLKARTVRGACCVSSCE